jgi:hypothetical protein
MTEEGLGKKKIKMNEKEVFLPVSFQTPYKGLAAAVPYEVEPKFIKRQCRDVSYRRKSPKGKGKHLFLPPRPNSFLLAPSLATSSFSTDFVTIAVKIKTASIVFSYVVFMKVGEAPNFLPSMVMVVKTTVPLFPCLFPPSIETRLKIDKYDILQFQL